MRHSTREPVDGRIRLVRLAGPPPSKRRSGWAGAARRTADRIGVAVGNGRSGRAGPDLLQLRQQLVGDRPDAVERRAERHAGPVGAEGQVVHPELFPVGA